MDAPHLFTSKPVRVRVVILQILDVDLQCESFTCDFDVHFSWEDPRFRGYRTRVWLPEGSEVQGLQRCGDVCVCGIPPGGVCCGLPYVEGIYRRKNHEHKITIDGYCEQEIKRYVHKEEPKNLRSYGEIKVSYTKLVELPEILLENWHLNDGHLGEVVLFRKMRATFKENFELRRFPFDRQMLQLYITAGVPEPHLRMEVDQRPGNESSCHVKNLSQFTVDNELFTVEAQDTCPSERGANRVYSQIHVMVHVERKPGKYMLNIVVLVYLLVMASFGNFMIEIQHPGTRVQIIVTFVLAILATKYLINDKLPSKPYETLLDWYLLAAYVVLLLPAFELLVLSVYSYARFGNYLHKNQVVQNFTEKLDLCLAMVLILVWNVLHLILWCSRRGNYSCCRRTWDEVRINDSRDDDKDDFEDFRCRKLCRLESESSESE